MPGNDVTTNSISDSRAASAAVRPSDSHQPIAAGRSAAADPMALDEDERVRWGSYYDQQPRVMAASVAESHAVLANLFKDECKLHALWHGALRAGSIAA